MKAYYRNRETENRHCYWGEKQPSQYHDWGFNVWKSTDIPELEKDWHLNKTSIISSLEKQFLKLAEKWKKETGFHSSILHITRNDNYLEIIGMGKDVVPFILKDLKKAPYQWFVALKAITKENPILPEHFGSVKRMRQDWLEWGKRKNLI